MPGPRMQPAGPFLSLVDDLAPTPAALRRVSAQVGSAWGLADPRSFERTVQNVRRSGVVAVKVAARLRAYVPPAPMAKRLRYRCAVCCCYQREGNGDVLCSPCDAVRVRALRDRRR